MTGEELDIEFTVCLIFSEEKCGQQWRERERERESERFCWFFRSDSAASITWRR